MKQKIIVVGSHGMAGHVIKQKLALDNFFDVIDIARNSSSFKPTYELDITDFNQLYEIIHTEKPAFIINCIGILNVDAEKNPDKAILLNTYLPHCLARICTEVDARLLHISTDCVFSGKKGNYSESDSKDGVGFYAQSKALGEVTYGKHITIRTSIIGPELNPNGIGLLHWFLTQKGEINGFTNVFWSGVTTTQLANSIIKIITEDNILGLVHLTNGTKISKYDLLNLFEKVFNKNDIKIIASDYYKVDKSFINTRLDFQPKVPAYYDMLQEMKKWMDVNKNGYSYKI